MPIALGFSAALFLLCYLMVVVAPPSKTLASFQLLFWIIAIALQVTAGSYAPDEAEVLRREGNIGPRLSTLTVIILGEGLNGICDTLRHSVNSIGLTTQTLVVAISLAFILYFIWLIYFDGYRVPRVKDRPSKDRPKEMWEREIWVWLHMPFHLCLILMLEGLKNTFLALNIRAAWDKFYTEGFKLLGEFKFEGTPEMDKLLQGLKISMAEEVATFDSVLVDEGVTNAFAQLWRWLATVYHTIIENYSDQLDPEGEYLFEQFIALDNATLAYDIFNKQPLFDKWYFRYSEVMFYSAYWVIAVAGVMLVWMGLLNTLQRRPDNRFTWGYSLNRIVFGIIVFGFGLGTLSWLHITYGNNWLYALIPVTAAMFGIVAIIDQLILWRSVRFITKNASPPKHRANSIGGHTLVASIHSHHRKEDDEWQNVPFLGKHGKTVSEESGQTFTFAGSIVDKLQAENADLRRTIAELENRLAHRASE